jgi:hypothetical protein
MMSRAITLTISDDDGDGVWVVTDNISTVYGDGKDPTHALFDWLRTTDSLYRELKRCVKVGKPISAHLQAELDGLRKALDP